MEMVIYSYEDREAFFKKVNQDDVFVVTDDKRRLLQLRRDKSEAMIMLEIPEEKQELFEKGQIASIEEIKNLDLNSKDMDQMTPDELDKVFKDEITKQNPDFRVIETLVDKGVDPNQAVNGKKPIEYALEMPNPEQSKGLIKVLYRHSEPDKEAKLLAVEQKKVHLIDESLSQTKENSNERSHDKRIEREEERVLSLSPPPKK
jgi:hypothetical protein